MKRIICLLLALMFCMYLPMPAFATNSPGGGGVAPWYCPVCGEYNTTSHCTATPNCPGLPHSTPQTGDTSMINVWVIVMIVALVALIVAVVLFRRTKKA